jgi:hypothetical protein
MIIGEVVETKTAYKPGQTDNLGNQLPLGSIEVRIGAGESNLGQVRNIYARPLLFSSRRLPLIGEQVILVKAPVNDWSTSGLKEVGYLYFQPTNSTDDPVMHVFPKLWKRESQSGGSAAQRKADKEEPGYSFPKNPKRMDSLQPFEGDDLYEGRFGQSIRFGSSVVGDTSIYDKKPTWKGTSNGDPVMILRVKKPGGSGQSQSSIKKYNANSKYTIEDLGNDEASIYLSTTQMLNGLKAGFTKNLDVKTAPNWSAGSQIIVDADRVVINGKSNKTLLIGKEEIVITGKKVRFQSENYNVLLDDLMDWLKKFEGLCQDLASAKAQYSTPAGPTAVSTNMADFIKLGTADFQKFKLP